MSLDVGSATRIHLSRVWQKRYVGLAPDPRAADLNHPRGGWNVEAWWLLNHNCFSVEAINEPLPHARLYAVKGAWWAVYFLLGEKALDLLLELC